MPPVLEQPQADDLVKKRRDIFSQAISSGLPKDAALAKVKDFNKTPAAPAQPQAQQPQDPHVAMRRNIYAQTLSEGQPKDRALQRVHEYNYAVQQGLSPDRASHFAQTLKFDDQPIANLSEEEKQKIATGVSEEDKNRTRNAIYHPIATAAELVVSPSKVVDYLTPWKSSEQAGKEYADAYAYARSKGWTEDKAKGYAESTTVGRAFTRLTDKVGDKVNNYAGWFADKLNLSKDTRDKFSNLKNSSILSPPGFSPKTTRRIEYGVESGEVAGQIINSTIQNSSPVLGSVLNGRVGNAAAKFLGTNESGIGKTAQSLDRHILQTAESLTSPENIALMVATRGEAAPEIIEDRMGLEIPVAIKKTARMVQQLAHVGFTAQMAHGTNQDLGAAWNALEKDKEGHRDVPEAIGYTLDAVVNGLMAVAGIKDGVAHAEIRADLDATTEKLYGNPQEGTGKPVTKFGDLDDARQALVINTMIEDSPEYQRAVESSEKDAERNAKKLSYLYGRANSQAWKPKATARAIQMLHEQRAEGVRANAIQDNIKALKDQREQVLTQGREARVERKQDAADERSEVGRVASGIAEKRDQIWTQRNEASSAQPAPAATRSVESEVDDQGNVTYPATYWGEQNSFGATGDTNGHAVYRQTPRGTEWLDANGNFAEEPTSLYLNPDPATADTLARLSSLSATADTLADEEGATPEQHREAEELASIRREMVEGTITAKEAQQRAGIAEKAVLPDEYTAARDGRLNGPFHEATTSDYYNGLREEAEAAGLTEEETNAILDESGMLARQQTEDNLNHVYRPGDHIISKRGVKWTLDSKGMLHPDDGGQAVPLMKRGMYSNDAVQLAQSGRVGYGTRTREERRAEAGRNRKAATDIQANQEEVDREMRLAVQREGLQEASVADPREDADQKMQRETRRMTRPPRAPESQIGSIVRMVFKAPADENSVIRAIAERSGVSPEEVMRLALANDPEHSTTTEAKVARLEVGDSVSDPFRKDKPWKVEQGKNGELVLRSGNASPLPLDRLNPSDRVRQLVEKGDITTEKPEFTAEDAVKAAFDTPYYVKHQEDLAEKVQERATGKVKDPEPRNEEQAKGQAEAAERRYGAAESVATRAVVDALQPDTTAVEKAEAQAEDANQKVKVAEEAFAQSVEATAKTEPKGDFPQRAPASVGLRGSSGTISQNSREIPFHYELLPLDGLVTSHIWQGANMVVNEDYPRELQPRTISEMESQQNALRAGRKAISDGGLISGYDFANYADPTINGSNGPAIVDDGGRVVGGNTRVAIMRRHLQNLESIGDPEEREAAVQGFKAAMRQLAVSNGIGEYPNDGKFYTVVRMMDKPIEDTREAANLGRLFNKPISVQITKAARGVSYARDLDDAVLGDIGRRIEVNDGLVAAISADPEFFRDIVTNRFGVDPVEFADWFTETPGKGLVLHEQGREQLVKALLGTAIKDTSVLTRLEGKTAYRALERALGYVIQMHALPERDISGKIVEALQAAAETLNTDPELSASRDKWLATYNPGQGQLMGMEVETPPEPDRVVEALWRSMHGSNAATPRVFSDKLKAFIGDQSSRGGQLFGETSETAAQAFNRAFSRELAEVKYSRGDSTDGVTDEEFTKALRNQEMSDVEREESNSSTSGSHEGGRGKAEARTEQPEGAVKAAPTGKMERPPKPPTPETTAVRNMAETKSQEGYVTPTKLKEFLETNPATKDHAPELLRTARLMAEYVFDTDPPIGVDRKDALDWVLKERLAGIEAGELKSKRGQYSDPNVEKNWGDRIMKLHQAADPTTFIHEFAHVIFPLLSDEDLKAIDTIRGKKGHEWDGTRKGLSGESYSALSEKLAHGMEQFLRDENPTGFTSEVKAVLQKIKDVMRQVYLKFAGDPLSEFENTEESREVFSKMFGITDFDVQDNWRQELKKARAEESRMKKPSEEKHPLVKLASKAGATALRNAFAGKVEDSVGERVDPRKPVATMVFADENAATAYWGEVVSPNSKLEGAELIQGEDGQWGIRFNTKSRITPDMLYQEGERDVRTDTPQFRRWFGDSRVVDEAGEPLRVYHGTDKDFEVFDQKRSGESTGHPTSRLGSFFSSDPGVASLFTGGVDDTQWPLKWKQKTGAQTVPTFLSISNPFEMTADQWRNIVTRGGADGEPEFKENAKKYIDAQRALLEKQGYDGVHVKGDPKYRDSMTEEYGHDNWVVFRPEQVKSAIGNRGTFDPKNPSILHQDVPRKHPGLELEEAKKLLAATPETLPALRKLRQLKVQNLENEIRAKYGAETAAPAQDAEAARNALQEVKNGRTPSDRVRTEANGNAPLQEPQGTRKISPPPAPPKLADARTGLQRPGAGGKRVAGTNVPVSLSDVPPVALEPLGTQRGVGVGTVVGEAFDAKEWQSSLKKSGLPENLPPPTWALDRKTAEKLIFPGQKQVVQTALSALEQGNGAVVATATGSGKAYTAMASIREWTKRNPEAKVLFITKNASLLKEGQRISAQTFGFDVQGEMPEGALPAGVYGGTYSRIIRNNAFKNTKWDLVVADESGEARRWYAEDNKQGKALKDITANSAKALYFSATPFHSPMEYGYLDKLNLWPKNGFDKWIEGNFAHEKIGDRVVAKLDPGKQAKLRQQLIERGQLVSQAISYEGFTAHFGVVPVTDQMKRGLDRIHEGFSRAKKQFADAGKKGMADRVAAFEATYTKAFLERERLPQAIELAKRARSNGWQVAIFSETSSEDLFRRKPEGTGTPGEPVEKSTYQQLDEAMGGQLSKIIPPFADVYDRLQAEFGNEISDFSGRGNSSAERESAKAQFLSGETPIMYTTYAAGGIGVSLHDADYPERGIKGGDKPRIAIFLGPPYSGVLLEQSMGRLWRFGVKSDTHAVFLATDSEPDVRLMQQKVGPRMRSLRASVLGERDSLASVMDTYTDEQKTQARQEALAYQEGNEDEVSARAFQVRSKSRNVGINDWSQINFPPADTAKNKGMKYGEDVMGGDWTSLYQSQAKLWLDTPPTPEKIKAEKAVESVAVKASLNPEIPRETIGTGAAAATEIAYNAPEGIDKEAAGRQAMEGVLNGEGFVQDPATGQWTAFHGVVKKMLGDDVSAVDERTTKYTVPTLGMTFEQRALAAGRKIKAEPQVRQVVGSVRGYYADVDGYRGNMRSELLDIFKETGIDRGDEKVMREIWDVKEGRKVSADPKINEAADKLTVFMDKAHDLMAKHGVSFMRQDGQRGTYKDIQKNASYMPHITDWDADLTDPTTGETKTLREITDGTLDEATKLRYMEAKRRELGAGAGSTQQWLADLKRDRRSLKGPKNANVTMRRELNHPFYKKDVHALDSYIEQVASAVAKEKNFGGDMGKLKNEISRIPSNKLRTDLQSAIATIFEHQDWSTTVGKMVRLGQGVEAITKMTLSPISAAFHGIHSTLALGKFSPVVKSVGRYIVHPKEFMREKYYAGVVNMRMNPYLLEGGRTGLAAGYFRLSGFDGIFSWTRAIVGDSAKVWMEQDALSDLKKGGDKATNARRLLKNTMLIGDPAIDAAAATGKWDDDSVARAQRAFTNEVTFSENPLQMPKSSRMSMAEGLTDAEKNWHAAVRGMYMLQSFSIKTYSLMRERLYDEVVQHGNLKPLLPLLLLYPAAGAALSGAKAVVTGGLHRAGEKLTGKEHKHDRLDTWLEQFKDIQKHPFIGSLKFYIDSLCTATAMDSTKRWTDLAMLIAMGEDKRADSMLKYSLQDELEQKVGGLYSDAAEAAFTQTKAAYDYRHTKNPTKKLGAAERDEAREVEELVPITRVVPWIDDKANPKSTRR